jgi:hypothetical protein
VHLFWLAGRYLVVGTLGTVLEKEVWLGEGGEKSEARQPSQLKNHQEAIQTPVQAESFNPSAEDRASNRQAVPLIQ